MVVALGTVFALVLAYQQMTTGSNYVFGSSAYSVTALVALIPLAVWLASSRRGVARVAWYACAGVIAFSLGVVSGSSMGALAVGFAALVSVAVHPAVLGSPKRGLRILQIGALSLAGLMVAGLVFVQVPALSGRWINADVFGSQRNLVSRVYLWEGAQQMLSARPALGFGPSGYRVWAVDYLNPDALRFGADQYRQHRSDRVQCAVATLPDLGYRHSVGSSGLDRVRRAARCVGRRVGAARAVTRRDVGSASGARGRVRLGAVRACS